MKFKKELAILLVLACPAALLAVENQCVECHSKTEREDTRRPSHDFNEWKDSVHAQKGITCDACHAGVPSAKDAAAAHKGLQISREPGSKVYFNRIPDTCGACHASELEYFKKSDHYKELQRSGKGPNCVTCHGSMATRVMSPRDLETICTVCHSRPTQAYAALITLRTSQKLLNQVKERVQTAQQQGLDVSAQAKDLAQAERDYGDALKLWHSFNAQKVQTVGQEISHRVRTMMHEIELKEKSSAEPAKKPAPAKSK